MNIEIKIDSNVEAQLSAQSFALAVAVQRGVTKAVAETLKESRNQMSRLIYNRPIPVNPKTGKPRWKRTSNLISQERGYYPTASKPFEGSIDNRAPYAYHRHQLDKPGRDGINRRAPWRTVTTAKMRPRVERILNDAVNKVVN